MNLKTWPNKILMTKCVDVDVWNQQEEVASLIAEMKTIVTDFEAHGIAANQIGSNLRVCVVSSDRGKTHKVMINPCIIDRGGEFIGDEACLSFPGVLVRIKRSAVCEINYLDEFFQMHIEPLMGFDAIVAQHEIDHLDGITLFQRAPNKGLVQRQLTKGIRTMKNAQKPQKMSSTLSRQIHAALKKVAQNKVSLASQSPVQTDELDPVLTEDKINEEIL